MSLIGVVVLQVALAASFVAIASVVVHSSTLTYSGSTSVSLVRDDGPTVLSRMM